MSMHTFSENWKLIEYLHNDMEKSAIKKEEIVAIARDIGSLIT